MLGQQREKIGNVEGYVWFVLQGLTRRPFYTIQVASMIYFALVHYLFLRKPAL
jgi:hypothetical protein